MKLACLRISVAVLEDLFVFFQCQLVPQEAKKCMVFGKCHNGHNNLISPGRVHRRCLASHSSMLSSAGSPSLNYRSRCGRQWCWPSVNLSHLSFSCEDAHDSASRSGTWCCIGIETWPSRFVTIQDGTCWRGLSPLSLQLCHPQYAPLPENARVALA